MEAHSLSKTAMGVEVTTPRTLPLTSQATKSNPVVLDVETETSN